MNNKKSLRVMEQPYLPLPLPEVQGNQEYKKYCALLNHLDHFLISTKIEAELQELALQEAEAKSWKGRCKGLSVKERSRIQKTSSQALRCNIVRVLSGDSFRELSFHLSAMPLLQQFCRIDQFNKVKTPGKSTLQEYSEYFSEETIREVIIKLTNMLGNKPQSKELGLSESLDLSVALVDSTCINLNVHYPVDWVLLKDAVRTLSKAIACIRRHGLKYRIQDPKEFISQMNSYCIRMTHSKRSKKGSKLRKEIFRLMKKLSKCVSNHAKRYRALLLENYEQTDLSKGQADQIIKRIDNVLSQLPDAIKQAHERIIGGRLVANEDKILSLYERHTQVYHRGKSGKETEFGLQFLMAESMDGLIVDWRLEEGAPLNDTQHIKPCLARLKQMGVPVKIVVTDRGFSSKTNSKHLAKNEVADHSCPRKVEDLRKRLQEEDFRKFQKRRAQTEARVGILKNCFIGYKMPMKGIERQQKHTAWCVLTHNLWLIARILESQQAPPLKAAA